MWLCPLPSGKSCSEFSLHQLLTPLPLVSCSSDVNTAPTAPPSWDSQSTCSAKVPGATMQENKQLDVTFQVPPLAQQSLKTPMLWAHPLH